MNELEGALAFRPFVVEQRHHADVERIDHVHFGRLAPGLMDDVHAVDFGTAPADHHKSNGRFAGEVRKRLDQLRQIDRRRRRADPSDRESLVLSTGRVPVSVRVDDGGDQDGFRIPASRVVDEVGVAGHDGGRPRDDRIELVFQQKGDAPEPFGPVFEEERVVAIINIGNRQQPGFDRPRQERKQLQMQDCDIVIALMAQQNHALSVIVQQSCWRIPAAPKRLSHIGVAQQRLHVEFDAVSLQSLPVLHEPVSRAGRLQPVEG